MNSAESISLAERSTGTAVFENVKWAAAQMGSLAWKVLSGGLVGVVIGCVIGIAYALLLYKLDRAGSLGFAWILLVAAAGFGVLGVLRGIQRAGLDTAERLVDASTQALASRSRGALAGREGAASYKISDLEAIAQAIVAQFRPETARFFFTRWIRKGAALAAHCGCESLLESCREAASKDAEGTLRIDAVDAASAVARKRAKQASEQVIGRMLLMPRIVAYGVMVVLLVMPIIF